MAALPTLLTVLALAEAALTGCATVHSAALVSEARHGALAGPGAATGMRARVASKPLAAPPRPGPASHFAFFHLADLDPNHARAGSPPHVPPQVLEGGPGARGDSGESLTAHPFNGFGHTLVADTTFVFGAPLQWGRDEWLKAGLGVAGIAALTAVDESIAHHVQAERTHTSDRIAGWVEPFGSEGALGVLGAFYAAGSALHDDRAKDVAADGAVASIIAGGIITPLVKLVIGRFRPSQSGGEEDLARPFSGSASFPSGHTTEAFAVASVIATHYEATWVKVASYGLASLVGLARIEHNQHFASDVLAGALIGTVVGTTVVHLDDERRGERDGPHISVAPIVGRHGVGVGLHLAL